MIHQEAIMQNMAMLLREAYLVVHRQTNVYLLKHGVTADQFVCLVILDENDDITQQELVDRANSDPNTIRAMLHLLEKRGLVTRKKHPSDGRARCVSMTKKGSVLYKKLVQELVPVKEKMLSIFNEKETEAFLDALQRLSSQLK